MFEIKIPNFYKTFNFFRYIGIIFIICSLAQISSAQSPDDIEQAVNLDKEAKVLIKDGQFDLAVEKYKEALSYIEHPDLLINLARAELKLGESHNAYRACSKALASPLLTPKAQAAASKCLQEAQKKMNEIQAVVTTYPLGAKLRLDGRSLGQTPWRGQLVPGRRQFDFELSGHLPVSRTVNAVPGAQIKLQVRLIPEGMGGLLSLNTTPEGANVMFDNEFIGQTPIHSFPTSSGGHRLQLILKGHLTESHQVFVAEGQNQEMSFYLKPLRGQVSATDLWPAWGLMSAGVLTSLMAGYFGYQALNARDQANDLALTNGSPERYDDYRFLIRDMESAQTNADIMWVTSSVMITSGLTWWLIAR